MGTEYLKVGTRLEIELTGDFYNKQYSYISQVLDIIDDRQAVLAAPIYKNRVTYIPNNTKIRVLFLHPQQGMLSVLCTIIRKDTRGNLSVMYITIDGSYEKIQRRKYFRLNCIMDAKYRIPEDDSTGMKGDNPSAVSYKKAAIKNISGSGMCLVLFEEIPPDTVLEVLIEGIAPWPVKTLCSLVRLTRLEGVPKKFEAGIHFIKINPEDTEAIIRYVFSQQRHMLEKGKA